MLLADAFSSLLLTAWIR